MHDPECADELAMIAELRDALESVMTWIDAWNPFPNEKLWQQRAEKARTALAKARYWA